ncbi:KH domain-containing protein [Myxococcota bacterium]|nr:KH domain-containing protein [Myxococcota bacterium]MBU1432802.1 KH domain-containing protein [Myxococcota bacterium]MBU1897293.1 KH domain-containing protein [Myxococcota bacterium]
MEELLTFILQALVSAPERVEVTREGDTLKLSLDEADRGAVIGRQGRTIRAISTVLGVAAAPKMAPDLKVLD